MKELIESMRQVLNSDIAIIVSFTSLFISVITALKLVPKAVGRHKAEVRSIGQIIFFIGYWLVLPVLTLIFSSWNGMAQVALNCLSISALCYYVCLVCIVLRKKLR